MLYTCVVNEAVLCGLRDDSTTADSCSNKNALLALLNYSVQLGNTALNIIWNMLQRMLKPPRMK